jgi:YHS domain-containing protein
MKQIKKLLIAGAVVVALTALTAVAEEKKDAPKPDKLTTCPVSGDKLGEMGKPYVFEYKGQEVKLCCKDCKKDFDKDPAKYIKKIEEGEKAKDAKN